MDDDRSKLPWHYVATGYVFSPDRRQILLVHHKKLGKWLPPGGHVEPGELPHACAIREVREETGVEPSLLPTSPSLQLDGLVERQLPRPFVILDELIAARRGQPQHRHIDFIFIMEAPVTPPSAQTMEVHATTWVTKQRLAQLDTFPAVRQIADLIMS